MLCIAMRSDNNYHPRPVKGGSIYNGIVQASRINRLIADAESRSAVDAGRIYKTAVSLGRRLM